VTRRPGSEKSLALFSDQQSAVRFSQRKIYRKGREGRKGIGIKKTVAADLRSAAEPATKNTHHGGTEKTQSESQNQNLNTEDTEKLGGRGGLKNTECKLKEKSFFAAWHESVC
jgi:DNA gyrase/topoisomerase IV subunit A